MTETDKQDLIDIVRQTVRGFEGIRGDLVVLGVNPAELEESIQALRDAEYKLLLAVSPKEPVKKA